MKRLVGPIEIRTLEEMEYLSMGKYLFFVSAQDACRAKRTLEKILIVVFGSVSTRGPFSAQRSEDETNHVAVNLQLLSAVNRSRGGFSRL
jgi:hypothetical protein